jgi:multidrug efflux pump subunit AcrB
VYRAIEWFARNHVAANLLMLSIIFGGLLTLPRIKQEVFPEVEVEIITVKVPYPGAAPAEVEEAICVRVEEQIQGVDGVDRVRSTASEGLGLVVAELDDSADMQRALDDIKSRVDAIDTFPEEAEEPVIEQIVTRESVISVAVWGDADERTLKVLGQRVRDEIAALRNITLVELAADRPYEISIEVSEAALRRHELTFDDVARAVRRSSLDLPGGSVKTEGGEILLRTKSQAYRGVEFESLVLLSDADGTRLTLGDVATVLDGFEDVDTAASFDGRSAVVVQVYRIGNQNALDVANTVMGYVASAQAGLPDGIGLTVWNDTSELLRARRATLLRAGRSGFALVILVLALFLRFRLAIWVALGVPVSFLGALWLMPQFDLSINMLSLFAFILVLGILVDDAIVTGENVHTRQQRDPDRLRAAIKGTQEISVPVTFGVLTTVAAFSPLLFLPGAFGRFTRTIPIIVIAALLFSLIESKLVLPSHLAHGTGGNGERAGGNPVSRVWVRFQSRVAAGLERFIHQRYWPFLARCLEWRYTTVAAAMAGLLLTVGVVAGGHLRFTFMPQVEADNVAAYLTMPQGTPAEETAKVVDLLHREAQSVRAEVANEHGDDVFRHVMATVGQQPYRAAQSRSPTNPEGGGASSGNLGEVNVELVGSSGRPVEARWVADRWRERVGDVPDAVEMIFTSTMFSTGEPINIQLRGPEMEGLRAAAVELKRALAEFPGVFDVADSFREGKQELLLRIRPEAEALGLSQQDLARQVRQAFYGEEAQRIQRGRDDVRVMVRYPADERRSLGDVENMRVRLPDGTAVPFPSVAEVSLGRGYASIERSDRQRIVSVTAEVDPTLANENEVLASVRADVLPGILANHPRVTYTLEGDQKNQREALDRMGRGFLLALVAIFALLAVPLGSYIQPLIIMSAIPFGFMGAIWGHLITGFQLSMMSVIGCVALSGVVVNDSLVLVSWVNARRREGVSMSDAVQGAGVARFRAILLTSLTTFAGLTPMMLERDVQARFMIPMAVALAFGVLFATAVTLLVVPCSYLILEDLRQLPGRLFSRRPDLEHAG